METKICTKCGKELPIEDFNWRNKAKGTRRSECKYCHTEYMKKAYQKKQEAIQELKSQCSCAKCGEIRGYVLDYHHINPETKTSSVARMVSNAYNFDTIQKEIDKCIVLCANCHREYHYFASQKENYSLQEYLANDNAPSPNG